MTNISRETSVSQPHRRPVSFSVTPGAAIAIKKIVKRVADLDAKHGDGDLDQLSLRMDLAACHANGCRLDFTRLLAADEFTLAHDVFGIRRHIDRETGKLTKHFAPKCRERRAA